jgi:hypothetical protein
MGEMRRAAKFDVSIDELRDALHMPFDTTIVHVYDGDEFVGGGLFSIVLVVAHPDLPEIDISQPIPLISPVMHYHAETYTWDWNAEPTA